MTSTSSHSLTSQDRHRGRPLRSCRPTGTVLLFSAAALLATIPAGETGAMSEGTLLVVACAAGIVSILAAARLMTILPDARVFKCTPASWTAVLMTASSAALWIGIVRVRPLESLFTHGSGTTAFQLIAATVVAMVCTTVAAAAAFDAHDIRHDEQHWETDVVA